MVKRKIVRIDEEKCTGCGVCIPHCAEGALLIIDGKARLVNETYCDGLGACLGECPQGAITIEERESQAFDSEAASNHVNQSKVTQNKQYSSCSTVADGLLQSKSRQWPVQLALVSPSALFLQNADLLLVADCVPFAFPDFYKKFLRNKNNIVLVACPKLDNFRAHLEKLSDILKQSKIKSITVLNMEVPCCSGLIHMANQALEASGKNIPFKEITVGTDGKII